MLIAFATSVTCYWRSWGCAAVRRPALVFLLEDWTTVRFWCFLSFFFFCGPVPYGAEKKPFRVLLRAYLKRLINYWLKGLFKVSGSRPCDAAGSLVSPTAAPSISVLQVTTAAFKNHTRQIGRATLSRDWSCRSRAWCSCGSGGCFIQSFKLSWRERNKRQRRRRLFGGGLGVFDLIPIGSGITASLKLLQRHETSSNIIWLVHLKCDRQRACTATYHFCMSFILSFKEASISFELYRWMRQIETSQVSNADIVSSTQYQPAGLTG